MAECSLFMEDEVYVHKRSKGYVFGLIIDNSESLSSSEDTDDEESPPEDRVVKGTVRVSWHPSGKETVIEEKKVHLADRSLMPGDVVRRLIPGQESQSGYVMDMDVSCHLHVKRSSKYIYNVCSKELIPLQKFESGQDVMLDSWLGKVENVDINLVLAFCDGARCQVEEDEVLSFTDINEAARDMNGEFGLSLFYPGQELRGPFSKLSEAKWLTSTPRYCHRASTSKKCQSVNVRVEKITTKSVEVLWVFRGYEKAEDESSASTLPPRLIQGDSLDRLQVLDWFRHCTVQIADRLLYRVKNDDKLQTMEPRRAYNPETAMCRSVGIQEKMAASQPETSNKSPGAEGRAEAVEEACHPLVGEEEELEYEDVDSEEEEEEKASRPAKGLKKKGRTTHKSGNSVGKFKVSKQGSKAVVATVSKKSLKERAIKPDDLVEVEVELTTSWATVMWQDGSVEKDIPSIQLFPVHHLDELEFFPGDFVLPNVELETKPDYGVVARTDHTERTCIVHWYKAFDVAKADEPLLLESDREVSVYDIKDHPDYNFRPSQCVVRVSGFEQMVLNSGKQPPAVGQVFRLGTKGQVTIKWSDGSVSPCFPQEIFIASGDADDVSDSESWESGSDYESDDSAETWETESEQEIIGGDDATRSEKDKEGAMDPGRLLQHKKELDDLLERAQSALARLTKLLTSFDVSLSSPDCFHDIIRIYRSCHDLDKILQSSFFSDPELQSLIGQARKAVKRDKENRTLKQLSSFFESWPMAGPDCDRDFKHLGTLAVGDKTYKVGTDRGATVLKFYVDSSAKKAAQELPNLQESPGQASAGSKLVAEGRDGLGGEAAAADGYDSFSKGRAMRKEYSEPSISKSAEPKPWVARRPSDPTAEVLAEPDRKQPGEANLVGENCVVKASKRTKSDSGDEHGLEAKKSREEAEGVGNGAQELCKRICLCLQAQILKINQEMQKRTQRLMTNMADADNPGEQSAQEDTTGREAGADGGTKELYKAADSNGLDMEPSNLDNSGEGKAAVCNGEEAQPGEPPSARQDLDSPTPGPRTEEFGSCKDFTMLADQEESHKFYGHESQPLNPRGFRNAVRKELKLFQSSLTDGIFIKGFEKRLDLYSVMIVGPQGTPYQDGLFFFDFKLPNDYPSHPPVCHYHSFCSERLNPNLYEDGKVCISLLGTWQGKGNEVWTASSNLLQVLLSIQGLILVSEPYYNEAGYEKQRGTQLANENSRVYNEMAILKTLQSLTRMCHKLPALFREEARTHLLANGRRVITRLNAWVEMSQTARKTHPSTQGGQEGAGRESPKPNPTPSTDETGAKMGDNSAQPQHVPHTDATVHATAPSGQPDHSVAGIGQEPIPSSQPDVSGSQEDGPMGQTVEEGLTQNGCLSQLPGHIGVPSPKDCESDVPLPDFPLFPMSRGFCLTLSKFIRLYALALDSLELEQH